MPVVLPEIAVISCFALLSIRKEITHGIPVDTFWLQAYRPWKIYLDLRSFCEADQMACSARTVQRLTDSVS